MSVLDAYALIAFLADEVAADTVEAELRKSDGKPCISSLNLAEVIDHLVRVERLPEEQVTESLDWVMSGGLSVAAVDEPVGRLAGRLRARHYRKNGSAVSLADCVALATSICRAEALATADPALAAMARAEGLDVIALPDTQGRKP